VFYAEVMFHIVSCLKYVSGDSRTQIREII